MSATHVLKVIALTPKSGTQTSASASVLKSAHLASIRAQLLVNASVNRPKNAHRTKSSIRRLANVNAMIKSSVILTSLWILTHVTACVRQYALLHSYSLKRFANASVHSIRMTATLVPSSTLTHVNVIHVHNKIAIYR